MASSTGKPLRDARWQDFFTPLHVRYLLIIVVCIGGMLRLWTLGEKSFWGDELDTLRITNLPSAGLLIDELASYRLLTYVYPPLYFLATQAITTPESSEGAYRILPAVAGTLTIPFVYLLSRLFVSRPAALVAALLFAVSPIAVHYSQENRPYALFLFVATAMSWGWMAYFRTGRYMPIVCFITFAVLSLYTSYVALLVGGCLGLGAVLYIALKYRTPSGRKYVRRFAIGSGAGLASAACFLPWLGPTVEFARQNAMAPASRFRFVDAWTLPSEMLALPHAASAAIWAAVVLCFTVALWRSRRPEFFLILPVLLVPVIILLATRPAHYHYRHNIGMLPFLLIVLVALGEGLVRHLRTNVRPLVACSLVVAGLMYSGQRLMRYYSTEKENWRDAVAFIASEARPNDRIITGIYFVEDAFSYYRHNWPPGVSIHPSLYSEEAFLSVSDSGRRVWYVTAFWHDLPPWLTERLHEEYTSIAQFEGDSPIYVYRKDPAPR